MREIKFRAWDTIAKKLTYSKDWTSLNFRTSGDLFSFMIGKDYTLIDYSVIIEQYTGLKDKNGKEIYEGDVINLFHPFKNRTYKGEIIYINYQFNAKDFNFSHHDDPCNVWESLRYIEIIGNIHEKPELIK